jgi:3-dehydroquinate synthase
MNRLTVELKEKSYDIVIDRGGLERAGEYFNLNRKVLIVSDEGVPSEYIETLWGQCKEGYLMTVSEGEVSKSFATYSRVCAYLLDQSFSRKDCIVAIGGGVVGDLAGFVAATFMRGIDFYNIPTTTLSQIDSSIGGKVAINLEGYKNMVGAFYQPRGVLIDSDTLKTLSRRHFYNGLVEALKAGLIYDEELFAIFKEGKMEALLDEVIYRSLVVKKAIVEEDETEQSLRKILNFGHTLGHGIESYYGLGEIYHGECVAMGMLPMIENKELKGQVEKILHKMHIKTKTSFDIDTVMRLIEKDKKGSGGHITIVKLEKVGSTSLVRIPKAELRHYLEEVKK